MHTVTPMQAMSPRMAEMRVFIIGTIGFLTLVDLFAAQAILPALIRVYRVAPGAMGVAVNASTLGMAIASLGITLIAARIDVQRGIWVSLALLAIPTALLASAPDLVTFMLLRILQGVFMASAFALTMTWLGDQLSPAATQKALAAYITGVVASNLIGRLISATVSDFAGLAVNFYVFAGLNLLGAILVVLNLRTMAMMAAPQRPASPLAAWRLHLSDQGLRSAFAIGFLLLFAFIGTFTYVNFVLTRPPIAIGMMAVGFVYVVFAPSLLTTPLAAATALRLGPRRAIWLGLLTAGLGLPMLILPQLPAVLAGMTLVAAGTFFAQAIATGYVGRQARVERSAASGLYLASYYLGGLCGAAILGKVFESFGWPQTVAGIALALVLAAWLARNLRTPAPIEA